MTGEREWVRANLTFKTAKRAMETARKAAIPTCPPTLVDALDGLLQHRYPPLYCDMVQSVVFHDFRRDGERERKHALILVNKSVLPDVIRTCRWLSMDGTFKITPRLGQEFNDRASQVLTITADYHGGVVVLFVVIMQCRKRPLYTKVFRSIKTSQPDFTPAQLMTDYEKAMRRAFSTVYPDSRLYGCR